VDSTFNKNKSELGVNILLVPLKVLAHRHGLLDQVVKIFRDRWSKSVGLEDT